MVAVLLLLAFGLGMHIASVQAGEMMLLTVDATIEQHVPAECTACDGDDMTVPTAACFAVCTGVQAATPPSSVTFDVTAEVFDRHPEQQFSDVTSSPDPFPPKLTILA